MNVGTLADIPASSLVGTNELVLNSVDSLVDADTLVGNPVDSLEDANAVLCFRRGCVGSRPLHPNASGATLISLTQVHARRVATIPS